MTCEADHCTHGPARSAAPPCRPPPRAPTLHTQYMFVQARGLVVGVWAVDCGQGFVGRR